MTIATAVHSKRIVGTALAYCPVPSCYSKEAPPEPEYVTCPACEGSGYDEDGDDCYKCDGDGQILNPKRAKKSKPTKKYAP